MAITLEPEGVPRHTGMVTERVRTAVRVEGIVQGVGFRPFVYALASRLDLGGLVGNDADGVFAEVEGAPAAVGEFLRLLERDAPPLARVDRVRTRAMEPDGSAVFSIVASEPNGPGAPRRALVSADTATCADCLRELADPGDRRFGYPFINCTNCGPRFTIVRDVPYDRARTTMAGFTMCPACAAEYADPGNRRFHAEPTCCPACGPALTLARPAGTAVSDGTVARGARTAAPGRRRHGRSWPGGRPGGRRRARRGGGAAAGGARPGGQGAGRLPPGGRRDVGEGRGRVAGAEAP